MHNLNIVTFTLFEKVDPIRLHQFISTAQNYLLSNFLAAENIDTSGEERAGSGQEASQGANDVASGSAAVVLLNLLGRELDLQRVGQQLVVAVHVGLDHGRHKVTPAVELALGRANVAEAVGTDGSIGSSAGVGAFPVGRSLLPGGAVAVGEDVPARRGGDLVEDLVEGLDEGFTRVGDAEAVDLAPLAVDDDPDVVVGLCGVVHALAAVGADDVVEQDGSVVAILGVDLLPGLAKDVEVTDVNHLLAVADLDLNVLGSSSGCEGNDGSGLHDEMSECGFLYVKYLQVRKSD